MQRILAGSYILRFESLESTNDFCKELIKAKGNTAISAAVVAEEQTKGRGQRGNSWHAEKGKNLTFSFICDSSFLKPDELFYLTKAISVAIVKALNQKNIYSQIKWPNDIYVKTKKLGGILIESSFNNSKLAHSIIGIGLNVNESDFPEDLNACSIYSLTGQLSNRDFFLEDLLNELDQSLWQIKQNLNAMDIEYFNSLMGLNEPLLFEDSQGVFTGIIRDVCSTGHLMIEVNDQLKKFDFKEIKLLL
jgi:BirA family biotin operon repressor/biotin-[acetyl-CoA-carboxylase] ligase